MSWIDISTPLASGMLVWPGDDAVRIEQTMFLERGDPYNLTRLNMSAHTGTHVDAPRHFIAAGADIGSVPFEAMIGAARVIEVHDPRAVRAADIPSDLEAGARLLFKTRNSTLHLRQPHFVEEFVYVSKEAAAAIVACGVKTVGIDYLSVGGFQQDLVETHEILLGAGVWVIEGIDLSRVEPGNYELICLPLSIPGADGAPARACLKRL
ncbi:MAG: cyclase family protein [Candidatus Solibacter usitatus]|nr:cyclase family protein [Candidatus Solibacter usitatus]